MAEYSLLGHRVVFFCNFSIWMKFVVDDLHFGELIYQFATGTEFSTEHGAHAVGPNLMRAAVVVCVE